MDIIVGLPAFNEEKALPKLLDRLITLKDVYRDRLKIIVINDGSSDKTESILKEYKDSYDFVNYINHNGNQGLGRAIYTLFCYATEKYGKDDILITLDADNTHNPNIIPAMVFKLVKEDLDVVIASRFVPGSKEIGLTFLRKIYSRGAAVLLKAFFPIANVRDYSCGFRAYKIEYLQKAVKFYKGSLVTSSGFECMAEILVKLGKIGSVMGEYPLVLEYNLKEGQSKMKVFDTIKGYFRLIYKIRRPI